MNYFEKTCVACFCIAMTILVLGAPALLIYSMATGPNGYGWPRAIFYVVFSLLAFIGGAIVLSHTTG